MATQVNVHEAKTRLSQLIEQVLAGEDVTIARAGKPVVDLIVHRSRAITIGLGSDRFTHDETAFDGTDGEVQTMFYGEQPT
ncbi:type II toxin-antitoxin system Phd/YefM family antitoxin [Blastococcus sp. Marseille-P5729]|uniref:type II toxin-antitoxin system Phd/YefM family antitoxin n=1 Tax=Blastococcus sp. Marseille-P5729 TaxID=2086582 RepID=UPI000D0FB5B9|nr:type II toxin-antitoxin system prevent-host-death family antitoxin [Blastococcus sp. Marseille-P5729]